MLLFGDVALFVFALWATLTLRFFSLPTFDTFYNHLVPFSLLFIVWVLVFFITGLYDKHTLPVRKKLPTTILFTQIINVVIAALFFFFIPYFGIAPKTNLVIYLLVSSIIITLWRLYIFPALGTRKREPALLIGSGEELRELEDEVNNNPRYRFEFVDVIDLANLNTSPRELMFQKVKESEATVVVIDTKDVAVQSILSSLYDISFNKRQIHVIGMDQLYEDIFDRIPLSLIAHNWFFENLSPSTALYDGIKRVLDILGAFMLALIVGVIYPFILLAMRLEDKGPAFITQRRIGQHHRPITVYKFRTMERVEHGVWLKESTNKVTRVGMFLRRTSIDEMPQFINILKGEMSLIGPRNDIEGLDERARSDIPYYDVRYTIRPGITGWAQIRQQYGAGISSPQSVETFRTRLSYDLYYIKNRSLLLDLHIALRTIQRMFFR